MGCGWHSYGEEEEGEDGHAYYTYMWNYQRTNLILKDKVHWGRHMPPK